MNGSEACATGLCVEAGNLGSRAGRAAQFSPARKGWENAEIESRERRRCGTQLAAGVGKRQQTESLRFRRRLPTWLGEAMGRPS